MRLSDLDIILENTGPEMSRYVRLLEKYLNALYPNRFRATEGEGHHKITDVKADSPTQGQSVVMSSTPKSLAVADKSIPKDFRTEFGIPVPSYPKQKKIFTDPQKAHEFAGLPYEGPIKKRRVNPKKVREQELEELKTLPTRMGDIETRIREISRLLDMHFSRRDPTQLSQEEIQTFPAELTNLRQEHDKLDARQMELLEKYPEMLDMLDQ